MLERNTLTPQPGVAGAAAAAPRRVAYAANAGRGAPGSGFTQTLQTVQSARSVTVDAGDTLIGMIRDVAKTKGQTLNSAQEFQLAQQVAQSNGIGNANRIFTGQKIDLSVLEPALAALATAGPGRGLPATVVYTPTMQVNPNATAAAVLQNTVRMQTPAQMAINRNPEVTMPRPVRGMVPASFSPTEDTDHPVLLKTLDRAVAKGFIPPAEKDAVYDKILDMSKNHGFAPDDFARMTLMESDGMNPRASNQRCHGIIQFCDGPARGAASAGYAANPKAILGLSVYQQLQLVDKYFGDVGLKNKGPAGLDDLYLSVLMPSARSEVRSDAPLSIGTNQAKALYEGRDTSAPMTRQSILQGLLKNAADRLGQSAPVNGRLQAMRTAAYEENTPQLQPVSTQLR